MDKFLPMTSPLPAFVVWLFGLTHCPWPSPLIPASLDGFYSGRSLDGEPPTSSRVREIISLPLVLTASRLWAPHGGRAEKERDLGLAGGKKLLPHPQPARESWWLAALGRDEGTWDPGDRALCPSPILCAFSCQGASCLQHAGCCSHRSCHLLAAGGDGALGGRSVPLLLQVSPASLPALHP